MAVSGGTEIGPVRANRGLPRFDRWPRASQRALTAERFYIC